ncbi:MAG TPA: alpha/beta fold hydrolase [Gaiellaceae bacterium]|nr:alpha/beta fold hydrolase [Gaiellaceae bacterium]
MPRSAVRGRAGRLLTAAIGCALLAATGTAAPAGAQRRPVAPRPLSHGLLATAPGVAARSAQACGQTPGLTCTTVAVPLDRSGSVPGTIALHVEVLPADGTPRGAVFLIAGGPGQGSAHVFGLSDPNAVALYRYLFPGYTLVAYDDRGTGDSGLIDCPPLQAVLAPDAQRSATAKCASALGQQASFYSTADHAADLDAVRAALGLDKVALFGVSYGTKLALAYALAYPSHVERLLLDSVLPPLEQDPFGTTELQAMPATLNAFCSDASCRAATRDLAGDVAAVANRLAAKSLQGKVLLANGASATQRVDAFSFLSMVFDADLNPGLAAELPAVVHAARVGNTQPLLRLARIHDMTSKTSSRDLSFGLYVATVCRDGPFPWQPDTPVPERPAIYQSAVASLPTGSFGPFGTWAAQFSNAYGCLDWPSPSGGGQYGAGPLPDVPVLALSGGFDMRTPTSGAAAIVAQFPHGHLLVVPGVGHSVVTADPSGCAIQAVRSWMTTGVAPAQCARPKPYVAPVPALPAPGTGSPVRPIGALATYAIAAATLKEAEAIWLTAAPAAIPGIFGGKLVTSGRSFTLKGYSIARGVTLSGTIRLVRTGLPLTFEGTVTVAGRAASGGILGLKGTSLRGSLAGRIVGR